MVDQANALTGMGATIESEKGGARMASSREGRAITDKQAAELARQAGKSITPTSRSARGVTVKTGSIHVSDGKIRIEKSRSK